MMDWLANIILTYFLCVVVFIGTILILIVGMELILKILKEGVEE